MKIKTDSFISEDTFAKMKQAEMDHPATEHTSAGGWCKHCGCGNDVLGYKHLKSCAYALKALELQALQSDVNDPANEFGTEALSTVRAAIAKAEGRTP